MSKTALITGASSGIGKAMAYIHAKTGGDLVITARSTEKLEELKDTLEDTFNISVLVIPKDLTKPEAAQEVYDEITRAGLRVDYLINNAGFGGHGKFYERDWESDHSMILLNIMALTALTRQFLPNMVQRNSGKILNVSSTAALLPGPLQAVYFATKAYVTSFSNAIAEELRDTNITVTTLMPGATDTGFASVAGMKDSKLFNKTFSAQEVAQAGYDGMIAGKLDVLAGLTVTQKVMMKTIPITPKKILLSQIMKMQEIE